MCDSLREHIQYTQQYVAVRSAPDLMPEMIGESFILVYYSRLLVIE